MLARILGIGLLLLACGIVSAGDDGKHEGLIKTMLSNLEAIGKSLKGIDGAEAAQAAKADLRKAADSWVEARMQAAKLLPPERDEKERLSKIYRPKFDEVIKRLVIEVQRVTVIPGGKDALKEIEAVLKKDGK